MPTAAVWGGTLCSDRGTELQALQVRLYSLPTGPPQSINYTDENNIPSQARILNKNTVREMKNNMLPVLTSLELVGSYQTLMLRKQQAWARLNIYLSRNVNTFIGYVLRGLDF